MDAFRLLARRLALALLLVAAADLAYPAGCADVPLVGPLTATICAGDHTADAGHDGEDCFCCSRTICGELVFPFQHASGVVTVLNDAAANLADAAGPPPYHPPLA
ncbi:MAG: hypothetical protein EXQ49_06425 [Acidobacteria bacterium]|nr:hypothetical protein [Acidobacteriota bacterium]